MHESNKNQKNIVNELNKKINSGFPRNPSVGVTYYINRIPYVWNSLIGWMVEK